MEKKIKGLRELKKNIYGVLKATHNTKMSLRIINSLFATANFLDGVQRMPLEERLNYWRCFFYLVDFLRQNDQLGRTTDGFNYEVREALQRMFCKLQDKCYDIQRD